MAAGDSLLRYEPSDDSSMDAHSDSVTQVKVLKAGDLFSHLEALIQILYFKTHAYVMASISNVAQNQMASTSSTADELQRELWLTQNRVDQAASAVTCASSIPAKKSGLLSLFPL